MAKIVILVPLAARTGGPEACYQLSDSLLRQGFEAEVWPVAPEDQQTLRRAVGRRARLVRDALAFPVRENAIDEYLRYRVRPYPGLSTDPATVFVLPEIYAWAVPLFAGAKVLLWWLSVDNAFEALARINLNYLRLPNVHHACQSVYAWRTVRALGFPATVLSDHTVVPAVEVLPVDRRPLKVCVNAGAKVIFDLRRVWSMIRDRDPEIDLVGIREMTRDEVYRQFSASRLYVDLGQFPGKDRMVREALLLGANVLVARAGAAANERDYPFPREFRWDLAGPATLTERVLSMVRHPEAFAARLEPARDRIRRERSIFDREVVETFRPLVAGAG